jgi:hypothetical protein
MLLWMFVPLIATALWFDIHAINKPGLVVCSLLPSVPDASDAINTL